MAVFVISTYSYDFKHFQCFSKPSPHCLTLLTSLPSWFAYQRNLEPATGVAEIGYNSVLAADCRPRLHACQDCLVEWGFYCCGHEPPSNPRRGGRPSSVLFSMLVLGRLTLLAFPYHFKLPCCSSELLQLLFYIPHVAPIVKPYSDEAMRELWASASPEEGVLSAAFGTMGSLVCVLCVLSIYVRGCTWTTRKDHDTSPLTVARTADFQWDSGQGGCCYD
jgi:hypothetical protein